MPDELLKLKDVEKRLNLSKSAIYSRIIHGKHGFDPLFPQPIKLGEKTIRWVASEVDAYVEAQVQARRYVSKVIS